MKYVSLVFIGFVLLSLLASFWYVGARLHALFGFASSRSSQIGVAAAVIAAAIAMLGAAKSASPLVGVLNVLGGYVFFFYLSLLLALLVAHAIQLTWTVAPIATGLLALAMAFSMTGAGALWADDFTVTETEIRVPGLSRELVVMHISDVHLGHHRGRSYLATIVEETNRHAPDLVLITGDLIDAEAALAPGVLEPLSQLAAPTYFVGGNHENYVDPQRAFERISQQNVRVLHNEIVETHGVQLVGLDYMNADEDTFDLHPSDDPRTIKSVVSGLPVKRNVPSLLMHHSPVGARYLSAKGVNLMLSGHTHAGQVFPFTLFAGLVFPVNRGLHQDGDTTIFVSQGAGTFMSRVRLGSSNEINLLTSSEPSNRLRPQAL